MLHIVGRNTVVRPVIEVTAMRKLIISALASCVLTSAAFSFFDVGNDPDLTAPGGYFSDGYSGGGNFYDTSRAETFELTGAPSFDVQNIRFWGGSENFVFPDLSNMESFEINIFDLSAGIPNNLLYSQTFATAALNPTNVGTFGSGATIYEFNAAVSTTLGPGTYALNIGANLVEPDDDAFVWAWNVFGTSDLSSLVYNYTEWGTLGDDLAFRVQGEAVPEPMTLTVLGGLALLAARRRKSS